MSPHLVDDFRRPDAPEAGDGWESLNPGYWEIRHNKLRRRLRNVGDRARATGFPYHYETHGGRSMPTTYDPSLPFGMLWRREWKLTDRFQIRISGQIKGAVPVPADGDDPQWKMYQPGYALLGICFGGQTLFESWNGNDKAEGAHFAAWRDDGCFGIYQHHNQLKPVAQSQEVVARTPHEGDSFVLTVTSSQDRSGKTELKAQLQVGALSSQVTFHPEQAKDYTHGYFGLVARGLMDFEIDRVELDAASNQPMPVSLNECHSCFAFGDSLRKTEEGWRVRFLSWFRNPGETAEIRIATAENPQGGWEQVPLAGSGPILSNAFRRNTAVIDARLPGNPAEHTFYYTIWKDGVNVTADPRLGTAAVGPGTGMVGVTPTSPDYVGRLPRLQAPYKLCGLSCHAINGGNSTLPGAQRFQGFWVHDQPCKGAYEHLEEFDFQVMLWEDDIWYMELLLYPPSTDDAYKILEITLAGPTSRWQMMRHWNVLNPGDHDHGMDDVKGPEQLAIRNRDDLGQDPEYMQRNFQIVSHMISGAEQPSPTQNPKRWRRWHMPNGDFSLLVLDARLWRSSQDTAIWTGQGWGHHNDLYSRSDPTRSLLGEEQFAWLQETIRTDPSPLICLTGLNGLHTVWRGAKASGDKVLANRDRVAADYAGWVRAGVDRVFELLGGRSGVVSVYGDVHIGSILENAEHRVLECSFGPIGRYGGRALKADFGPVMQDFDGRPVRFHALYHQHYQSPQLDKQEGPPYWNFLEMSFDPRPVDSEIELRVRNLIDSPSEPPRGGGEVHRKASQTGRQYQSRLGKTSTLANALIRLNHLDGRPILGTRSNAEGRIQLMGLADVTPGTELLMVSRAGGQVVAEVVSTIPM